MAEPKQGMFSFFVERNLTLDFKGGSITSDAGLLSARQLDGLWISDDPEIERVSSIVPSGRSRAYSDKLRACQIDPQIRL